MVMVILVAQVCGLEITNECSLWSLKGDLLYI